MSLSRQLSVCLSVHLRLLPSNALLLAAPGPQDAARFECVVSNEAGEARRLYQVTVHGELGPGQLLPPSPGCSLPAGTCAGSLSAFTGHLLQEALSDLPNTH